jgi:uncharacterized protein (UPF0305 family)
MPESYTKSVINSDIKRREDIKKSRSIPCCREYTIIAITMFVWARKRYGRNDYVDHYMMTHFRKVLDEIDRLHKRDGTREEIICRANMIFTRELHRIAESIKWIYE